MGTSNALGWLFWAVVLGGCFGWLFWAVVLGGCFERLFWAAVLGGCFGWLFYAVVLSGCFGRGVKRNYPQCKLKCYYTIIVALRV